MPTPETIELASERYVFACIHDRKVRGGSHVYEPTRHFAVTNLGWLLRHAHEVFDLYVLLTNYSHTSHCDSVLAARLIGGAVYVCPFASQTVLHDWLDRPRFRGLRVTWDLHPYIVGSTDYRAIGR